MAKSKLAEIKTKQTANCVDDYIHAFPDEQKRKDSLVILEMMKKITKETPKMWGSSIIGFGLKRYKSPATGREVDWFLTGFSPRKTNLTIYLVSYVQDHAAALKKLGKHKTGGGCIYFNKLEDINLEVLERIIKVSFKNHKG